jgi:hypothetical protein
MKEKLVTLGKMSFWSLVKYSFSGTAPLSCSVFSSAADFSCNKSTDIEKSEEDELLVLEHPWLNC